MLGLPGLIASIFFLCDSVMERKFDGNLLLALLPSIGGGLVFVWVAVTGRLPTGMKRPSQAPRDEVGDPDASVWSSQPANQPWKPREKA